MEKSLDCYIDMLLEAVEGIVRSAAGPYIEMRDKIKQEADKKNLLIELDEFTAWFDE